jgi:hypothetical protein
VLDQGTRISLQVIELKRLERRSIYRNVGRSKRTYKEMLRCQERNSRQKPLPHAGGKGQVEQLSQSRVGPRDLEEGLPGRSIDRRVCNPSHRDIVPKVESEEEPFRFLSTLALLCPFWCQW